MKRILIRNAGRQGWFSLFLLALALSLLPGGSAFAQERARLEVIKPQGDRESVIIRLADIAESYEQCLNGGLEIRYRFEFQLCRHRSAWFDSCEEVRRAINRVQYDPITSNYTVKQDVHRDGKDPDQRSIRQREKALRLAGELPPLDLSFIARGENDYLYEADSYLSVRLQINCEGAFNKTLARISQFLTLGLVETLEYDSGWQDVYLRDIPWQAE